MGNQGATPAQIDFAKQTQFSMDPRDVSIHRDYINQFNPQDPWRQPNNFVMHSSNYQFGPGQSSPQSIGTMLGTLPGQVQIAGPPFMLNPYISPHVVFRPY